MLICFIKNFVSIVPLRAMSNSSIEIVGARVHNLKNISVNIPKNKLIVITGVSGSGKSSLTMDTLFAEGQRRYVESLSSYARQFLTRMNKPEVDYIKGLCPAIAIEQKVVSRNTRSTIGSMTEMYDYLRILFARVGRTYSPISQQEVKKHTVQDVVNYIMQQPVNERLLLLVQLNFVENALEKKLQYILHKGYSRILVNNSIIKIQDAVLNENINPNDSIYIVIDRFTSGMLQEDDDFINRLKDSVQSAFAEGQGSCFLQLENGTKTEFSSLFTADGLQFEIPTPQFFNFNSPYGACKRCEGFGNIIGIDEDKVIPNTNLSVFEGAIACWKGEQMSFYNNQLVKNSDKFDFPIHRPVKDLSKKQYELLWNGNKYFTGLHDFFKELESQTYKIQYRVMLARYRGRTKCTDCGGSRIRKDANYVLIDGKSIGDLLTMNIDRLKTFFENIQLSKNDKQIAERLLHELNQRLQFMQQVGLGYLTLNRTAETLSGGETQRINLTRTLGSNLTSSLYILDEPSIGLHPRDSERLIQVLNRLRDLGNTVVVVEHEEDIIRSADYIIDIGPKAGSKGGELTFAGNYTDLKKGKSLTTQYLNKEKEIETPSHRRKKVNKIVVEGAREHNLKNIDVEIPLSQIVVITGVSGSGKTTLVKKILYPALKKYFDDPVEQAGKFNELKGDLKRISNVELINQSPIGKSSRSNPVTYVKAYDAVRELFANLPLSKVRNFKPSHFSFNVDGGRCETCQGEGETVVEMQFMADIYLECESCKGKRFKRDILEVEYKGKNISDVLHLTVDDAIDFFETDKEIKSKLQPLQDVGLGYVQLGQSSSTLSGGEAQRVKLATFLHKGKQQQPVLFIFDEPTTGLHFDDIKTLMRCFNALVENGHSVVIIEHNMDVIKCADYIIDLGPEGGENGGNIVAQGTPEEIVKVKNSYTAKFLKEKL